MTESRTTKWSRYCVHVPKKRNRLQTTLDLGTAIEEWLGSVGIPPSCVEITRLATVDLNMRWQMKLSLTASVINHLNSLTSKRLDYALQDYLNEHCAIGVVVEWRVNNYYGASIPGGPPLLLLLTAPDAFFGGEVHWR